MTIDPNDFPDTYKHKRESIICRAVKATFGDFTGQVSPKYQTNDSRDGYAVFFAHHSMPKTPVWYSKRWFEQNFLLILSDNEI